MRGRHFWYTWYHVPQLQSYGIAECLRSFSSAFECPNIPVVRWLLTYSICITIVPGRLCSGDNRTVANACHSCSPGYSSLKSHSYWLKFFVKDHLRNGVLSVDQALTTDKGLSMQRAWHGAWTINEQHLSYKNRPRCYAKSPTAQDAYACCWQRMFRLFSTKLIWWRMRLSPSTLRDPY